jgi:CRISPR-associated protein Csd2
MMKLLIPKAYDLNRSAIRSDVRIRHAWYIEHLNALGSCPDYMLLDALTPKRIANEADPSTSWADYEDRTVLPEDLMKKVSSVTDLMLL